MQSDALLNADVDLGPMARLRLVVADPQTMEVVGQRVMDGETLKAIARSWQVPVMGFVEWVTGEAGRCGIYSAALRVRADQLAHEVVDIADGDGDSRRDALRVKTRLTVAGLFDREKYGTRVVTENRVTVDAPLAQMTDAQLLEVIERAQRDRALRESVIEGEVVEPLALAAAGQGGDFYVERPSATDPALEEI